MADITDSLKQLTEDDRPRGSSFHYSSNNLSSEPRRRSHRIQQQRLDVGHTTSLVLFSSTPLASSNHGDSAAELVQKKQKTQKTQRTEQKLGGKVTKHTSPRINTGSKVKEEEDDEFVLVDSSEVSQEIDQVERRTKRESFKDGFKIEEETTERFRWVRTTTTTKQETQFEILLDQVANVTGGPFVTLSAPTLGDFLAAREHAKLRRKVRRPANGWDNKQYRITFGWTPFPEHVSPTPEECRELYAILTVWLKEFDGTVIEIDVTDIGAPGVPAHGCKGHVSRRTCEGRVVCSHI